MGLNIQGHKIGDFRQTTCSESLGRLGVEPASPTSENTKYRLSRHETKTSLLNVNFANVDV